MTDDTDTNTDKFFTFKDGIAEVKHTILKKYLGAWFAIMWNNKYGKYDKLVYIDGFAGEGEYTDGLPGSPMVALELALTHTRLTGKKLMIELIFIEKNEGKCKKMIDALSRKLEELGDTAVNASVVKWEVRQGKFTEQMNDILETDGYIEKDTPVLVFADPYGFNGELMPMVLMRRILKASGKTELFINVMDGFANRFFNVDTRSKAINILTGVENNEWRDCVIEAGPLEDKSAKAAAARRDAFISFYIKQLTMDMDKECYTIKFGMRNKNNRHKYHLVFCTQHPSGLLNMKRSMIKDSDSSINYSFSQFNRDRQIFKEDDKEKNWKGIKEMLPVHKKKS